MKPRDVVVVMCKAPVLGNVKTRLASSVGHEAALQAYTMLLRYIVENVGESTCDVVICLDGDTSSIPWYAGAIIPQRGDDLGERLIHAVTDIGKFNRCLIVGSDAPFVDAEVVGAALECLAAVDVVLGPALDGGYYLIGISNLHRSLFYRINWSTEYVLLQTIERCTELSLRVQLLEPMSDIDTLGDIMALEAPSPRHSTIVSRLRAVTMLMLLVLCLPNAVHADGGWIRAAGELFGKVSVQTLSTKSAYDLNGVKSVTPAYSLMSVGLYAEYGVVPDLMVILNAPLFRQSSAEGVGTVGGIGDIAVDVRYGIVGGEYPVSVGLGIELPTGNEAAAIATLPTGDGELNMWINAGVSHSFWPTEAFVSADAGYNVRGLAVSEYTRQFDNGQFTNQYRVSLKGGYKLFDALWATVAIYRFATAGTAKAGRFTFNGLGEGVEYNAWDAGFSYEIAPVILSLNVSSAFTVPRAIYGGVNAFIGLGVRL